MYSNQNENINRNYVDIRKRRRIRDKRRNNRRSRGDRSSSSEENRHNRYTRGREEQEFKEKMRNNRMEFDKKQLFNNTRNIKIDSDDDFQNDLRDNNREQSDFPTRDSSDEDFQGQEIEESTRNSRQEFDDAESDEDDEHSNTQESIPNNIQQSEGDSNNSIPVLQEKTDQLMNNDTNITDTNSADNKPSTTSGKDSVTLVPFNPRGVVIPLNFLN